MITVPSETPTPHAAAAAHEPMRRVLGTPAPTVVELRVDSHRLRVQLLTEFRAAWSAGDHDRMSVVMKAAADLDDAHPDEVPLRDEFHGVQYGAVA
ncbi:hypothetical protein [Streptomyces violascens]|uniref:hypothetical protein n=1 Tax=Streptomyces violascens TaxID=67381 RepID=UPI00369DCFB7